MEFEYTVIQGPSDIALHLTVRNAEAILVRNPEAPRVDGAPVGVFRGTATSAFLEWIGKHGVPPAPQAAPSIRPDMPVIRVRYARDPSATAEQQYVVPVPSQAAASPEMRALAAQVETLAASLETSAPLRTVAVESVVLPAASTTVATVRLRNAGTAPVDVNWKLQPVRIFGLLDGAIHDLTAAGKPPEAATVIAPRGTVDVRIPVQFPAKGNWQVRAVYQVWFGTRADSGPVGGAAASKYVPVAVR